MSFSVLPSSIIIRQLGQKSEAFGSVDVSTSPAALLSQCWHNCVNAEPTHGCLSICQPLLFPHEQLYRLWPQKPAPAKLQDAVFVPINEIKMSVPRLTLKGLTSALSFNWYDYIIVFANTMQLSLICSCFTTFGLLKTSHWKIFFFAILPSNRNLASNIMSDNTLKKGVKVKGRLKTRDKTQEKEQDNKTCSSLQFIIMCHHLVW